MRAAAAGPGGLRMSAGKLPTSSPMGSSYGSPAILLLTLPAAAEVPLPGLLTAPSIVVMETVGARS